MKLATCIMTAACWRPPLRLRRRYGFRAPAGTRLQTQCAPAAATALTLFGGADTSRQADSDRWQLQVLQEVGQ